MTNYDIENAYFGADQVDKIYLGDEVVWPTEINYEELYLTVESITGGTFNIRKSGIGYSINDGSWTTTTGSTALSLNAKDKVRFKSTGNTGASAFTNNTSSQFKVYGNVESMEYGDNFSGKTSIGTDHTFQLMFSGCTALVNAENLILPATTLKSVCYYRMFYGCNKIEKAPELPAAELPSLAYKEMFCGCTNLNYIKCLATSKQTDSTTYWVMDVQTNSGTFVKDPSTNVGYGHFWVRGIGGCPENWTVIDNA